MLGTSIILALLSALSAAFVSIFGKIGLKEFDANTATAIRSIVMAIFLISIVIIQGKTSNLQPILRDHKALTFIILSGIMGATSWLFYFWSLKIGKVAQLVAIDKLSIVFAIIMAALFLGEKITLKTGAGVLIMVAGAILVALG